jgi:DNA/RNA-binding domain of Phe-tRNA-synthetase-like protein
MAIVYSRIIQNLGIVVSELTITGGNMRFEVSDRWRLRYPGAVVACMLVTGVSNPERAPVLDGHLDEIEHEIRGRYAGYDRAALRASSPFAAYERYYKQFGQTYHVQHQVESVALKGKPIPRRAVLVEAAFAEELRSGILTAMHDADAISEVISADVADGSQEVVLYNGKSAQLDAGDMFMRDETGILTTVVRGPAEYGLVTPDTTSVAVCVYAPEGIGADAVTRHLDAISANMRLISDNATIAFREVISA